MFFVMSNLVYVAYRWGYQTVVRQDKCSMFLLDSLAFWLLSVYPTREGVQYVQKYDAISNASPRNQYRTRMAQIVTK